MQSVRTASLWFFSIVTDVYSARRLNSLRFTPLGSGMSPRFAPQPREHRTATVAACFITYNNTNDTTSEILDVRCRGMCVCAQVGRVPKHFTVSAQLHAPGLQPRPKSIALLLYIRIAVVGILADTVMFTGGCLILEGFRWPYCPRACLILLEFQAQISKQTLKAISFLFA